MTSSKARKQRLLATAIPVVALAVFTPAAAFAQDDGEAQQGAQTSDNAIIVTAQKREQALSDVSLAVTAIGEQRLVESNTYNIEGLQRLVPSISFGNDFNFAKLFIRGVGLSSSLPGVDPSVAFHVDGMVVSLAQAQLGSMFDLERVEVLRGPQGTLYGRNATGGAVNLITAKPTDEIEGYVRLGIQGPDLGFTGEAAVGGPLTEKIRGRLALQVLKRDGYGINELTGNDIDNANQFSTRAHLEFLPTETLSILLTGEYHSEDDRSLAIKFREVSFPGVLTDGNPANDGLSALGQRANADGSVASFSDNPRNLRTNFDPVNDRDQWALSGIITLDASDELTLKSLTSYRDFDAIFFQDFDMSSYLGFPLAQTGPIRTSANHWQPVFQHQFSQELQANLEMGNLHAVGGLFYLDETIEVENHIGYDVLTNTDPYRVQFDGSLFIEAWAAYANLTYDLNDQFSVKAGGRYSWEKRHLRNNTGTGSAALNQLVLDPLQWDDSTSWNDFSPMLGVEFRPDNAWLLYAQWSRGFKSGTAEIGSTRRTSTIQPLPFVDPENIEAFEAGSKYAAGNLNFNLALFYHQLDNGQFSLTRPIASPPFFVSTLTNAAQSEAYGAEIDLLWRPVPAFAIDASLAYLHSEFTEFFSKDPLDPALFGPGGASVPDSDLSGNATRMSPRWSFTVHPEYEVTLGNGGSVFLGSNFAYKSKQYHTEFNDDRLAQDGYIMLDANVRYVAPDGRFSANAWVQNLTDELVYAGSFSVSTSRAIGGTLMPPRTFGLTLGYQF